MTRSLGLLVAALVSGCSALSDLGGGSTGFRWAYFHDDCAPWDGRALTLLLSDEELASPDAAAAYPWVRVSAWRPPEPLAGASIEWMGSAHDSGSAVWCDAAESCRTATSVVVGFLPSQPSPDVLTGRLRIEFEGRPAVEGAFEAVRLPLQAFCGG